MRIAQVLRQVYPVDPSNVDDELVERYVFCLGGIKCADVLKDCVEKMRDS